MKMKWFSKWVCKLSWEVKHFSTTACGCCQFCTANWCSGGILQYKLPGVHVCLDSDLNQMIRFDMIKSGQRHDHKPLASQRPDPDSVQHFT
jgi:hypothetical protein